MGSIYKSPLRVYLVLGFLAIIGLYSCFTLSTSLFPGGAQASFHIAIPYGNLAAKQFAQDFGTKIESQIKAFKVSGIPVETIEAEYTDSRVLYDVTFSWGLDSEDAEKELRTLLNSISSSWPDLSRRDYSLSERQRNQGFLALSFYSKTKSLEEVYEILHPIIAPQIAAIDNVGRSNLYNPNEKRISVELNPEKMALLQVLPNRVAGAIETALVDQNGGSIRPGERSLTILIPSGIANLEQLKQIQIPSADGQKSVLLQQISKVALETDKNQMEIFRTQGVPSLILFASPKSGGNVKKMSDDIMNLVHAVMKDLPQDIQYRVLVNPSEFITASIRSVFTEVGLAALLAVAVLFLFIGSFKNVITAAIEIPLSMILAFILMRITGMNLNLISLGGLALSAGMNVDASVVVMENIFRHFALIGNKRLTDKEKLQLLLKAVNEVRLPVITSTVASLVVFIPLILTRGLTNSILGDLAKAVVFSHGFSAFVALILVPTVRLQMLKSETQFHIQSPLEKWMVGLETKYRFLLKKFIQSPRIKYSVYLTLIGTFFGLLVFILPSLPHEIIGHPDTDWIDIGASSVKLRETHLNDAFYADLEKEIMQEFGSKILCTFTEVGSNWGNIMIRLKDKKEMSGLWKDLEEKYKNTPLLNYSVSPWNPSEMPIPDPPHFKVNIVGGTPEKRSSTADEVLDLLQQSQTFPRLWTEPSLNKLESIQLHPNLQYGNISGLDLAAISKMATEGRTLGLVKLGDKSYPLNLHFPEKRFKSLEDFAALPLGVDGRVLPLKALTQIKIRPTEPIINRINQRDIAVVFGRENESQRDFATEDQLRATELIQNLIQIKRDSPHMASDPLIEIDDPAKEFTDALTQLKWTLIISTLLVFLVMVLQFGDLIHAGLVMVSIPLGIIGVVISLFIFKSTLSLNSILGVILLNGISVANSIILVDYMKKLNDEGMNAIDSALHAAEARLRPILMTSLTTCLGMLPVAFGLGEGGKILQPLGIAVSGGLWFSMIFTLFIVPALQVQYLEFQERKHWMPEFAELDFVEPSEILKAPHEKEI